MSKYYVKSRPKIGKSKENDLSRTLTDMEADFCPDMGYQRKRRIAKIRVSDDDIIDDQDYKNFNFNGNSNICSC